MRFALSVSLALVISWTTGCDDAEPGGDDGGTEEETGGGDLCAQVDPSPNTIGETQVDTAYPAAAGGTVVDGTYYLSRFEVYAPATADAHVRSERIDVSAGTLVSTKQNDQDPIEVTGGTFTVAGTSLELDVSCPEAAMGALPFTATDTELWLFDPSEPNLKVYLRQ